jgi:hypothetical protein
MIAISHFYTSNFANFTGTSGIMGRAGLLSYNGRFSGTHEKLYLIPLYDLCRMFRANRFVPVLFSLTTTDLCYFLVMLGMSRGTGLPFLIPLLVAMWMVTLKVVDINTYGFLKRFFALWLLVSPIAMIPLAIWMVESFSFDAVSIVGTAISVTLLVFIRKKYGSSANAVTSSVSSIILFAMGINLRSADLFFVSAIWSLLAGAWVCARIIQL